MSDAESVFVTPPPPMKLELALPDHTRLHAIYSAFLAKLPLHSTHRKSLVDRGLDGLAIDEAGFKTWTCEGLPRIAAELGERFGVELYRVPGFVLLGDEYKKRIHISCDKGILIPIRNFLGSIVGIQIRRNGAKPIPRYKWMSSAFYGGPSCGSPIHVPRGTPSTCERVRGTEGGLKAIIAFKLSGVPTLGFAGINHWPPMIPIVKHLQAETVRLAFDSEITPGLLREQQKCAEAVLTAGHKLELERWPADAGKGIDDVLAAGGKTWVHTGAAALDSAREWKQQAAADDAPAVALNGNGHANGEANGKVEKKLVFVKEPVSKMASYDENARWLWRGILARGAITLLCSHPKTGKTTMLSHLFKLLETGGEMFGLAVMPSKVLVISEEPCGLWADRRDHLGLTDRLELVIQPFLYRPKHHEWHALLDQIAEWCTRDGIDLVVFDTISRFWPLKDENDNAQLGEVLQPLRRLPPTVATLLNHHLRKSEGDNGTATRGGGDLLAFIDINLEFKKLTQADAETKREITARSRYSETPLQMVVALRDGEYVLEANRTEISKVALREKLLKVIPREWPGFTEAEIVYNWPFDDPPGRRGRLLSVLADGTEQNPPLWYRKGAGRKANAYVYALTPPAPDEPDSGSENAVPG